MTIKYNVTGPERKKLVQTIAEILECDSKYLGAPSFAYQIDYFTVDKNGVLSFDDSADSEEVEQLIEALSERGFEKKRFYPIRRRSGSCHFVTGNGKNGTETALKFHITL